jgi:hypothetical protein
LRQPTVRRSRIRSGTATGWPSRPSGAREAAAADTVAHDQRHAANGTSTGAPADKVSTMRMSLNIACWWRP